MSVHEKPVAYPYLGPEPLTQTRVFSAPAVPTAIVRAVNVPMATIATLFDEVFGTVFPAVLGQGVTPAGAPFALYNRFDNDDNTTVDIEVGFPVTAALAAPIMVGKLVVEASQLPGGLIAAISHVGAYDELGAAWGTFTASVDGMGFTPDMPCWETYVTEPTPDMDPASLRTDLFCPVKRPASA